MAARPKIERRFFIALWPVCLCVAHRIRFVGLDTWLVFVACGRRLSTSSAAPSNCTLFIADMAAAYTGTVKNLEATRSRQQVAWGLWGPRRIQEHVQGEGVCRMYRSLPQRTKVESGLTVHAPTSSQVWPSVKSGVTCQANLSLDVFQNGK